MKAWAGRRGALALALVLVVALVYARVPGHGFLTWDDDTYVLDNPAVQPGLTSAGVRWAFTESYAANWHPLTWLSHMLDVELFGLTPTWPHVLNVLLHATNAVLLLLLLGRTTGAPLASAFVAALFALHPLRVESVAWIAERKDLLGGAFWMATLLAYVGYARRPGIGRHLLVSGVFALGLMAKPTLVTLPCVLLLLDLWPLGRWSGGPEPPAGLPGAPRRALPALLLEKVPWLALSAGVSVVTFFVQRKDEAVSTLTVLSVPLRVSNSLVSYVGYVGDTLWPANLSCIYLHPGNLTAQDALATHWKAAGAALLLVAALAAAFRWWRRRPWLLVGLAWYLGTLVPMIGLVQVGVQSRADRYTYLPTIGLYVAAVWGLRELALGRPGLRRVLSFGAPAVLVACALLSFRQTGFWRDSVTLFRRAVDVEERNYVAYYHLGNALSRDGRLTEALAPYERALEIDRGYAKAYNGYGYVLSELGRLDEAETMLRRCLALAPRHAEARTNLGMVHVKRGDLPAARREFQEALAQDPDLAEAHNNLGGVLARLGQFDPAEERFRRALALRPRYAEAENNLGLVFQHRGRFDEARHHFRRALEIQPDFLAAVENLAILAHEEGRLGRAAELYERVLEGAPSPQVASALAGILATSADDALRDGARALALAQGALQSAGPADRHRALTAMAAALAELGRFDEAVRAQEEALALAPAAGRAELTRRLELYRAGRRLRR